MDQGIALLTQKLRTFAEDRNWAEFHSPKNLASALSVEAGELLEHFQWLTDEQSRHLPESKTEVVALEVADVFLYLLQLSDALQIDLLEAASKKMLINEQKYPADLARGTSKKYTEL